jgi:hypothetical protein
MPLINIKLCIGILVSGRPNHKNFIYKFSILVKVLADPLPPEPERFYWEEKSLDLTPLPPPPSPTPSRRPP